MPTMLSEVYDALLEAGASDDKARKAAESVAAFDTRFTELRVDLTAIRGQLSLLTWMSATALSIALLTLGGVIAVLWRGFHP